jgi:hypothetical protein
MATLFVLAANLLPLAGVWFWGWDAFLVLMIYWAETVIVAGWTLARIATLPGPPGEHGPGRFFINAGKTAFFALHAGIFIAVHLFFLLVLFSGEWSGRARGPLGFFNALFIETGAWVALLFAFVAGLIGFVTATPRPTVVSAVLRRFDIAPPPQTTAPETTDQLTPIITALYTRIVVMQVGIIFGAWVSEQFGNRGPLAIVVALKTVIELGIWRPWAEKSVGSKTTAPAAPDK